MQAFSIGDPLIPEEVDAVLVRLIRPDRLRKARRQVKRCVQFLINTVPARFEHEVNRVRGLAFDIGEHGSSYQVTGYSCQQQ